MSLINLIIQFFSLLLSFISSITFIIILSLLILLYHFLLYLIRDSSYIKAVRNNKDLENIELKNLKNIPLINIIIPAWKEGKEFEDLLLSITKLKYPKVKVIVNAGGSEKTIQIANAFKTNPNFIILYQKGGKERAALGKITALNECLNYVTEGILYMIDADCYITDDLLLRMIYPITNQEEEVVIGAGIKPLESQKDVNLSKYLEININRFFKEKFSRYYKTMISGANTMIIFDAMKRVGKFKEDRNIAEDISRGIDIQSKGYRIYSLVDDRSRIPTDFPKTIKEFFEQRKRQIENSLIFSYRRKSIGYLIKFLFLYIFSLFLLILPIFLLYNIGLFYIGLNFLLFMYLKRIRAYIFYKKTTKSRIYEKFRTIFFLKMVFYIYIEIIHNIFIPIDLFIYKKKVKNTKIQSTLIVKNPSKLDKPFRILTHFLAKSSKLNNFFLRIYYKSVLYRIKHIKHKNFDWLKEIDLKILNQREGLLKYKDLKILLMKNSLSSIPLHQKYLYAGLIGFYKIPKFYLLFWDDLIIFHEFFIENLYDKKFEVENGDFIFDVGSSIGWYALKMSKKVGEKGKVIAIEPDPNNFYYLKKNLELNNLTNVMPLNLGAWSNKGKLKLVCDKYASLLYNTLTISELKEEKECILINVDTIDNIVRDLNLEKVDLIKMDIEGAELEAIKGANNLLLKSKKLKLIIAAYHTTISGIQTYENILPYLKNLKFRVYKEYLPYIYAEK